MTKPVAANAPYRIEVFSTGEDNRFLTHSSKEIRFTLNRIAQEHARVVLYYDDGDNFILTTLLGVNEQGLWLDHGPLTVDNRRIAHSREIIFVSSHRQVKVQFSSHQISQVMLEGRKVFFLPLPDSLLRLQRREYFRLLAPVSKPLQCSIPVQQFTPRPEHKVTIMDISVGGVALVCEEHDTELQPGKIYPDCRIMLPDFGILTATIEVRTTFRITQRNGMVHNRAGCQFTQLDGATSALLQRYVTWLQSERLD